MVSEGVGITEPRSPLPGGRGCVLKIFAYLVALATVAALTGELAAYIVRKWRELGAGAPERWRWPAYAGALTVITGTALIIRPLQRWVASWPSFWPLVIAYYLGLACIVGLLFGALALALAVIKGLRPPAYYAAFGGAFAVLVTAVVWGLREGRRRR